MKVFYIDTSAMLKLLVDETHAGAYRRWASKHSGKLVSCDVLRTELLRAALRYDRSLLAAARLALQTVHLVRCREDTFDRAGLLTPETLRSLDAIHIASALEWGSELQGMVTYDLKLALAAAEQGIQVLSP